ncbi:hypothetical protein Srufu_080210 (plasmid) [Streptomyces libani subsp. rufus]|nr:hypothetical protein Srufu_080210 [Streptomyces libani subsp. rufus]
MPTEPEPREAVEAPPWKPADGPPPHVQTWPRTTRPTLVIRIRGQWRRCPVIAVHTYRDGQRAVQVDVHLDSDTSYQARTYRWDPDTMSVVRRGEPPLEL